MQNIFNTTTQQQELSSPQDFTSINDIFPNYNEWRDTYVKSYDEHRSIIESDESVREYHEALLRWLP